MSPEENISLINSKKLKSELEKKRKQMIEVGIQLGLSNPETLRISQEVDTLLNELICMNCQGSSTKSEEE